MSKSKKPTVRQHYVPQSYLRNFTSTPDKAKNKQMIFQYDKQERLVKEVPVKDAACVKNIYAYDVKNAFDLPEDTIIEPKGRSQAIESVFSEFIEPLQAEVIRKIQHIVDNSEYLNLSDTNLSFANTLIPVELKESLASCIVFQYLRTDFFKRHNAEQGARMVEQLTYIRNFYEERFNASFDDNMDQSLDFFGRLASNDDFGAYMMTSIFSNKEALVHLTQAILQYSILLTVNESATKFITSDVPVQLINHGEKNLMPYFGTPNTEIVFVLTPKIAVTALYPHYGTLDRRIMKDLSDESVNRTNRIQFDLSRRFVFSQNNELALLEEEQTE